MVLGIWMIHPTPPILQIHVPLQSDADTTPSQSVKAYPYIIPQRRLETSKWTQYQYHLSQRYQNSGDRIADTKNQDGSFQTTTAYVLKLRNFAPRFFFVFFFFSFCLTLRHFVNHVCFFYLTKINAVTLTTLSHCNVEDDISQIRGKCNRVTFIPNDPLCCVVLNFNIFIYFRFI